MIEKDCKTCFCRDAVQSKRCLKCIAKNYNSRQPSDLYTAYLQEKERADKAEAEAADLQESHLKLYGDMKEWKSNCRDTLRKLDAAGAVVAAARAVLNPDDEYYLAELALEKALQVYDGAVKS